MDINNVIRDTRSYQEGVDPLGNLSSENNDEPTGIELVSDYTDMMIDVALIGDYPFDTIMEGIREQFKDYINIEDSTNYVEVFYDEWNYSRDVILNDEEEDHPQEMLEALDRIKSKFVSEVFDLFESRLTITIMAVDNENTAEDEVEYVIRKLYEFFIMKAADNFRTVITKSMLPKIQGIVDDREYFRRIEELLVDYDPLIRCVTPTEFIQYCKDDDILNLFEDGLVVGNFLRKYSAKLYQNEEFKIDVINNMTMIQGIKEDMLHGEQ